MGKSVQLKTYGLTDIGRVRQTNQDSFLVDDNEQIYIVADGMGGHAGGEVASQLCIENVFQFFCKDPYIKQIENPDHPDSKVLQTLAKSINFASAQIYERALEEPSLKGMGTTATVLKVYDDQAYCAHVGDSRLYLIRQGLLYQMTYDHSLVSEQVRAGILTQEEAELHHLRNVITRSVGYQEEEDVDSFHFPLEHDDMILICSDGLYGKVSDIEISRMAKDQGIHVLKQLVSLANERGGDDNITIIAVSVQVS